jgi:acyl-CoA thioesterase FadM
MAIKERMLHIDTGEVLATYETVDVFCDPQTRKSSEMPASVRQALESRPDQQPDN